jgi:hypothetical protein
LAAVTKAALDAPWASSSASSGALRRPIFSVNLSCTTYSACW